MKKIFFLFIICVVALSLTFCGQQKPAEKPATEKESMESAMPDTAAAADTAGAMMEEAPMEAE
ncbi:MAG: hypothetical protein P8X42_12525 [Calditrichaceae bacterium]|jgi:predicted small lipoprotein YifL